MIFENNHELKDKNLKGLVPVTFKNTIPAFEWIGLCETTKFLSKDS
jgi:hypothetical protein